MAHAPTALTGRIGRLRQLLYLARRHGWRRIIPEARYHRRRYERWQAQHALTPETLERLARQLQTWVYQPLISILMPVFNVEPRWLQRAIDSAQRQLYPNWELCIVDDGSTRAGLRELIERHTQQNPRIRATFQDANGGIAHASNAALQMARGEFIALLDHDDELTPDALLENVRLLNQHPNADMIYSDEDKIDPRGSRCDPYFKPDWSPDLLLCCMYTCHLGVYRRALVRRIGGFREGFDGAQDYDLVLRLTEHTQRIYHIPKILYHWRMLPGSLALSLQGKRGALERAQRAVGDALQRRNLSASVEPGLWPGSLRVRYEVANPPRLSILIYTVDPTPGQLAACMRVLQEADPRGHWEVLVVSNTLSHGQLLACLPAMRRTLPKLVGSTRPKEDPALALNRAVSYASGGRLLFLADGCYPTSAASIEALLEHSRREEIGAVGGRVLTADGKTVDCGLVLNLAHHGLAGPHSVGLPAADFGYFGLNATIHNLSALSLRALLVRRHVLLDVGGFPAGVDWPQLGPDLCLRLHLLGLRNLYTPFATFVSEGDSARLATPSIALASKGYLRLRQRWAALLSAGDPYYNPNLSLERGDFSVALDEPPDPQATVIEDELRRHDRQGDASALRR